jgi:4-azaleucine resistance transporter AzlC
MKLHPDFVAGMRAILPILLGVVPFAMITGVGAVSVGMTPLDAMGMSVLVFAGASQLVVMQLMSAGSLWIVMVLTAWVVNLRFSMYSATLAPYFKKLPLYVRAPFAYILSDQAFAITIHRFNQEAPVDHKWFYFGAAGLTWLTWQASALVGALIGAQIPASWGFDFAFPLTFMALMFAALKDRPTALSALVGGSIAVLARPLPYNLGLVLAAVIGIAAGMLAESSPAREAAQ